MSPNNRSNDMPDEVKPTPSVGRDDGDDGQITDGRGGSALTHGVSRKAGVIIRASVEHVSLVGETELNVTVKWPASTFCVPPCDRPAAGADGSQNTLNVPANAPTAKIRKVTGTQ